MKDKDQTYYSAWLDNEMGKYLTKRILDPEQIQHANRNPKQWINYFQRWWEWYNKHDDTMSHAMAEPNPPLYFRANND